MKQNKLVKHLVIGAGIGLFIAYVLIVFQPFGTANFQHPRKNLFLAGYGAIIFFCYVVVYWVQERVIKPNRILVGIKLWVSEGLVLFFMILVSLSLAFFYHHLFIGSALTFKNFLGFLILGGSIAILPVVLIIIVRYLQKQKKINQAIANDKIRQNAIILRGTNKGDKNIEALPANIVYIVASGNYIDVYTKEGETLQKKVLRNSLGNIQEQLPEHCFMKVHRSYIVNNNYFGKVYIKSSKYLLVLKESAIEIPLSRSVVTQVKALCQ
jgi:hypothetical protein